MITRFVMGAARPYRGQVPSDDTLSAQLAPIPGVIWWVGLLFLACLTLVLTVVMLARMDPSPSIVELPVAYWPPNPLPLLPKDANCSQAESVYVTCRVSLFGKEVSLSYELGTRMIVRTAVPSREYRVGDLLEVWGAPRSITQRDDYTYLYWETRYAILYTKTLQPGTPIDYIVCDLTAPKAAPWRGFTTSMR